jgi:hypothetical protein
LEFLGISILVIHERKNIMRYFIGLGTVLVLVGGLCWLRPIDSNSNALQPRVTLAEVTSQIEQTIEVTQVYVGQQRDAACQQLKPRLEAIGGQLQELAPPTRAAWSDLQSGAASALRELDLAVRNAIRRFQK